MTASLWLTSMSNSEGREGGQYCKVDGKCETECRAGMKRGLHFEGWRGADCLWCELLQGRFASDQQTSENSVTIPNAFPF